MKVALRGMTKALLRRAGLEVRRASAHDWKDTRTFIPFAETLAGAGRAGIPVGDYVEQVHNLPGAAKETIGRLAALGVFQAPLDRICEIGPGSGRYLEKVLAVAQPSRYEIYETAHEWAGWLVRSYPVVLQPTDGSSLSATPSSSIDLVHAHKVFTSVPLLITWSYLLEMARVVRIGGRVVFDAMTERCVDLDDLEPWLKLERWSAFPAILPRQHVIDLVKRRGLRFEGSFLAPMEPARTEYMVFAREA